MSCSLSLFILIFYFILFFKNLIINFMQEKKVLIKIMVLLINE